MQSPNTEKTRLPQTPNLKRNNSATLIQSLIRGKRDREKATINIAVNRRRRLSSAGETHANTTLASGAHNHAITSPHKQRYSNANEFVEEHSRNSTTNNDSQRDSPMRSHRTSHSDSPMRFSHSNDSSSTPGKRPVRASNPSNIFADHISHPKEHPRRMENKNSEDKDGGYFREKRGSFDSTEPAPKRGWRKQVDKHDDTHTVSTKASTAIQSVYRVKAAKVKVEYARQESLSLRRLHEAKHGPVHDSAWRLEQSKLHVIKQGIYNEYVKTKPPFLTILSSDRASVSDMKNRDNRKNVIKYKKELSDIENKRTDVNLITDPKQKKEDFHVIFGTLFLIVTYYLLCVLLAIYVSVILSIFLGAVIPLLSICYLRMWREAKINDTSVMFKY